MQLWYSHPLIAGFMTRSLPAGYESLPGYADRGWPTCESSWIALAKVKRKVSWAPVFDVVGETQFRQPPPMTPAALARLVASKRFTSKKGDLPMVIELNTRTIISLFRDVVELGYTALDWGNAEMVQLCKVLPFCRSLTKLLLYQNKLGDESMIALAGAVSKGALPALKELFLYKNNIADAGMIALAGAVGKGALASLETLALDENKIGDDGLKVFAEACRAKGALDKIEHIYLFGNPGNSEPVDKVLRERKK